MKKVFPLIAICLCVCDGWAAPMPAGRGRASYAGQMTTSPRATVSKNQIAAMAAVNNPGGGNNSALAVTPEVMQPADKDLYQAEKEACVRNNIGMSDTFVWASRNSNPDNYSTMVEDVNDPSNNTCFVKVALKSRDTRINLDDIPAKYFEMGYNITCGSWTNEDIIEQKILDAKKSGRVWGTIGATVAGAGVGVGVMELFGNEMIGGAVQGQASMEGVTLIKSQLLTLKEKDSVQYNAYMTDLKNMKKECDKLTEDDTDTFAKLMCKEYEGIFDLITE